MYRLQQILQYLLIDEINHATPIQEDEMEEFRKIIEMEGVISVHAELDSEYSHAEYQFKLNLDGFKKACTFL